MPTTGSIMVNVFDGSRQPWHGPDVNLVLSDPFTGGSNKKIAEAVVKKGMSSLLLSGVLADAGQRYILSADASKHRSHHIFPVKPKANVNVAINIMLVPDDPKPDFSTFSYDELKLRSPQFHQALSANISEASFRALAQTDAKFGAIRMATLLNIEAKLRATPLKQGLAVDFTRVVNSLDDLERDRLKVRVADTMPTNVRGLKAFVELNEDLNELNHKGFPVSFKEKVAFCSLQLSFAKKSEGGLLAADVDIDQLTDIGHFGEVIKNKITKMKTDPFTIYVLLFDQGIRPLYTIKV